MKWWKALIAGGLFIGAAGITVAGLKERPAPQTEVQISRVRDTGERFDVAALDMLMPEMDGCELARRIRRQPNGQELPLVLLTSLAGLPQARSVRASQLYNALVSVFTG